MIDSISSERTWWIIYKKQLQHGLLFDAERMQSTKSQTFNQGQIHKSNSGVGTSPNNLMIILQIVSIVQE